MPTWITAEEAEKKFDLSVYQLLDAIRSGLVRWEPAPNKEVMVCIEDIKGNFDKIRDKQSEEMKENNSF
jgi:hypothetical protein